MKKIETVELDAPTKRKWFETRTALLWRTPAFSHILFTMMNPQKGEMVALFTEEVPIAATDGTNLILNPKTFFEFKLDERVFIVAHEILHCILNHCVMGHFLRKSGAVKYPDGVSIPYDHDMMNKAMDYVINDILVYDKVGTMPQIALRDQTIATWQDSFTDTYRKLYDKEQKGGGKGSGQGNGQKGFDQHLAPGTGTGQDAGAAAQGRSDVEWNTAIAAAMASAKAQGRLPAGMARLFTEIIDPQVDWRDAIRALFARKVGGGGYDWRKPDRQLIQRDIYAPRRSGNGCENVVVAIDTSGSIGQNELNHFFGEMKGIIDDVRPEKIYVLWIDAKLHKVDEVEDSGDIDTLKPAGGGGTSFIPAFEWIEEQGMRPDALVYMTDMLGSFPDKEPTYPVIWADIHGRVKAPFGDTVRVDLKK